MEQTSKLPTNVFTHFDTFNIICSFLHLKDKLSLSSTCKLISFFLEEHFSYTITQGDYDKVPDKTMRQLIKYNFNRNLKVVKIPSILAGGKQESTFFNYFKNKCITRIDAEGKYFAAFQDNKNQAYVSRVNQYWPAKYNPNIKFQTLKNVSKISCKAEKLFSLATDGVVTMGTAAQNPAEIFDTLSVIGWSLRIPVLDMATSKNYAIFILGNVKLSQIKKAILLEECLDTKEEKESIKIVAYNLQTLSFYLINYPYNEIRSFCVGSNTAYFVNENNQLIHSVLTNLNEGQSELTASVFPPLENKRVISIFGGLYHYIALIREDNILENWNNEQVIQWLRRQGFDDYINIMKVEKIDGKKLLNMEKKFMQDRLGITNTNLQQKILLSIEENMKVSYNKDELLGWGKNETGQLGNSMVAFANKPIRIKLPELNKNQHVVDVICGWYNSILKTSENRIFITTQELKKEKQRQNQKEKQKERKEEQDISDEELKQMDKKERRRKRTEDEEDKETKGGKKDKKKKGTIDQKPVQKQKQKYEEQPHWVEYKNQAGCFNISSTYKQQQSKKKIRTVKAVLDKILWDPKLNKEEYKVGYFDKYMGVLDIKVEQYLHSEVKEHRICYLKRNGQIVWHKEDKIDIV